jgi:ATP-dependent helicase/nuclease subunit B
VTQALLTQALQRGEPAWVLQADGLDATGQALADPFGSRLPAAAPQLLQAADGEDEALAAASAVLQALNEGAEPVALVAEDRLQVRRVRALLERAGVPVLDETGWTLATTRAAAQLMALLRAVHPQAGSDDRLNWLKAALPPADELALVALEAHWRGAHGADAAGGHSLPPPGPARTLWQREQARLRSLASLGPAPADLWLQQLHGVLAASDAGAYWSTDAAALQVRRALGLAAPMSNDPPAAGEGALLLDLDAFTAWVDATLERAVFTPPPAAGPARVVVTPLARAIARPFACAVLPGSDEQHLGPPAPAPSLLPEAVLRRLGLPDRAARAWQQAAAFVQLQRLPRLVLLQRQAAGDEALGPSPLLQRLLLARRAQGLALPAAQPVALAQLAVAATPVAPPQPVAPQDLPSALSASTLEALRDCPYRFFSRAVLRLREDEELDQEAAKRDYGNWLHAVLQVFHDRRAPEDAAGPLEEEAARLVALADDMVQRPGDYALSLRGLDAAELLAFRVDLDGFARRYLQWLRTHEALGWRYERGESAHEVAPAVLGGMRLKGRIDRIDRLHASRPLALAGAGAAEASQHDEAAAPPLPLGAAQVLDYKTGSLESLRGKVRQPLEDTQLAFYAALLLHGEKPPPALRAGYLALDSGEAVQLVAHRVDVADSAEQMLQGLAHELDELRAGAALPALGQGRVCELCEARGLCRRDHWADT